MPLSLQRVVCVTEAADVLVAAGIHAEHAVALDVALGVRAPLDVARCRRCARRAGCAAGTARGD